MYRHVARIVVFVLCDAALFVAPVVAQGKDRPRVALLELTARGVEPGVAELVSEMLADQLSRQGDVEVVSQKDVRSMVSLDQSRQILGCTSDAACYTELGGMLTADRLVAGAISQLGASSVLTLQYIDTQRGNVFSRANVTTTGQKENLIAAVGQVVGQLLEIPARVHVYPQVPGARILINDRVVGITPLEPFPVRGSGAATLRVEHFAYPPFEAQINLAPGRVTRVKTELISYDERDSRRSSRNLTGAALLGVGALGGVAAGVFLADARRLNDQYGRLDARTTTQQELDDIEGRAKSRYGFGYSAAGLALVAVSVGAWLLLTDPWAMDSTPAHGGSPAIFHF